MANVSEIMLETLVQQLDQAIKVLEGEHNEAQIQTAKFLLINVKQYLNSKLEANISEHIECAALLHESGIHSVEPPERHYHIIKNLAKQGFDIPIKGKQGFLTNKGRFVNRKEAADIALKAGQIKNLIAPPNLFTEDLW